MTIFITGKVGKHPGKIVQERFEQMSREATAKGYNTFQMPCCLEEHNDLSKEDCIKTDIRSMLNADALFLDSNWNTSKRSVLLRDIAMRVGMDVLHRH